MNILLTTLNSKYIHSSLALRYLKNMCRDLDVNVQLKEFTINNDVDLIVRQINEIRPDVVGFSCYIWNIEMTKELAFKVKAVLPDVKIIFGGPEVSFDTKELMQKENYIDYVVVGEGEVTFQELVSEFIKDNEVLEDIKGLVYRKDGEIHCNTPRALLDDLSIIPSPYLEDLAELEDRIVYFESSRGCPFNCKFCLSSTLKGIRYFKLDRIKKELKKLIDAKVRQVKFVDRTFNTDKDFAITIMKHIMNQNVEGINFHFEVTAHILDDEMLEFLKTVPKGLFQFEIGVQSTNPKVIKEINRTTDFEKLSRVVRLINSYNNIHQHLDLIAGLPLEDYNSYKKSFNDVFSLHPEKLQMGFLKLLKGTVLRNEKEHGFVFYDKPPYEVMYNKYISYDDMSKIKEIEHLVEKYSDEDYFDYTLKFILKNFYEEPFDFFEDFAEFWVEKEYNTVSHSKNKLYVILDEFYREREFAGYEVFNQLLKYDYLTANKNPSIPSFMYRKDEHIIQKGRHIFLKETKKQELYMLDVNKPIKKAINDIHIEKFTTNILEFAKKGFILSNVKEYNSEVLLLFKYLKGKNTFDRCNVFDITDEFTKLIEER